MSRLLIIGLILLVVDAMGFIYLVHGWRQQQKWRLWHAQISRGRLRGEGGFVFYVSSPNGKAGDGMHGPYCLQCLRRFIEQNVPKLEEVR